MLSNTQDKGQVAEGANCFANDYHESVECGPRFGQFKHTQLNREKKAGESFSQISCVENFYSLKPTRRNDLKADIDLADMNNSAKLMDTISMSKQFHLFCKYFTGLKAIIFRNASAVKILVNTFSKQVKISANHGKCFEFLWLTNQPKTQ